MKARILVAVVAVPVLFFILFFLPPFCTAILTAIICGGVVPEYYRAVWPDIPKPLWWLTLIFAVIMPPAALLGTSVMAAAAVLLLFILFAYGIAAYEREKAIAFEGLIKCFFVGAVYPAMMACLVLLKNQENGRLLVMLPIVITWCCDSAAYFAGVYLGKHKVTPRVSPHKSAEGFIGGIVGGILCTLLYGLVISLAAGVSVDFLYLGLYGLLGSAVCELGDLAYSLIKRQCGIKDYGNLIPGHGGMLDRFDSMSFVAPAVWILFSILPAVSGK